MKTKNDTSLNNTNQQHKGYLFNNETFENLKLMTQKFRDENKPKTKNFFFENKNQEIYEIKQQIEDATGVAPSYKTLVNKILCEENLLLTTERLLNEATENNLIGYTPDIQIIANETINKEILNTIKNTYIEKYKHLEQ